MIVYFQDFMGEDPDRRLGQFELVGETIIPDGSRFIDRLLYSSAESASGAERTGSALVKRILERYSYGMVQAFVEGKA